MQSKEKNICIYGVGQAAREARKALTDLGILPLAFLALPEENAPEELDALPVHSLAALPDHLDGVPVLLAGDAPRKASKMLAKRSATATGPVFKTFAAVLEGMAAALAAEHPLLFPDRPDPDNRRMFDYDRSLLPNKLLALYEEGVHSTEESFARSGLTIGYPGWNLLYYSCLCALRPGVHNLILETGANVGCSTIVLAQAIRDSKYRGSVVSVDLDPAVLKKAAINLELAGLADLVSLHQGDSVAFLKDFDAGSRPVPFAFLDGCHEAPHVFAEFQALHPKLDAGSVVFFDNVDEADGVAGALRRIMATYGGNVVRFENASWNPPGQAVWQADGLAAIPVEE